MPFASETLELSRELTVRTTSAMASVIEVLIQGNDAVADQALQLVDQVFGIYEAACSRFVASSELNEFLKATGQTALSPVLSQVLRASFAAYVETGGRFDPRVRQALEALGYDRTFSQLLEPRNAPEPRPLLVPWENPLIDEHSLTFAAQSAALDFGGIAKGAALAAAAEALRLRGMNGLICAGGDVVVVAHNCSRPWPIAIEDPIPSAIEPIAAVEIEQGAVMTSSVRLRQWRAGTTPVHHLIDPRTGAPGGEGLSSVTVIGDDPVSAEVWSKTLFLGGFAGGFVEAELRGLAAVFVSREGEVAVSSGAEPVVTWVRPS